jgi:hypothetical protein
MLARRRRIGVIGSSRSTPEGARLAEAVGRLLGEAGVVLICGGLGGVMEAAARGAAGAGGLTVGLLPGMHAGDANRYIALPLPTGLSYARNLLVVRASQAVVAIEGGYGTLSEIAFALQLGVPVIGLHTGYQDPKIRRAGSPEEAVSLALTAAGEGG